MKTKTLLFFLVSLCLFLSCPFTAVALEPQPLSSFENTLTITIAGDNADAISHSLEDPLLAFLEEKFNIVFSPLKIDANDASYTYRLLAASNDFPDIMLYDNQWDFGYFIQTQALRALPTNMGAFPHLKTFLTYPYSMAFQYNGKIWGLPRSLYTQEYNAMPTYCILVHRDLLEAYAPQKPVTFDQWHGFLAAAKEANPTLVPLTTHDPSGLMGFTTHYFSAADSWVWDEQSNSYVPGFYTQAFRDSIRPLRTLWQQGLLDEHLMETNTARPSGEDQFLLKQAAAIIYPTSPHILMGNLLHRWSALYPQEDISQEVEILLPPCDDKGYYAQNRSLNLSGIYFGANISDEKLDRLLHLFDYLCSEEGLRLRRYGFENIDYEIDDQGNILSLLTKERSLYHKYPSYAFFRTLPDLDTAFLNNNKALSPFISNLIESHEEWKAQTATWKVDPSSILASTASTAAGIYFNPSISQLAFKLIISQNSIENAFIQAKEEFQAQGIDNIIFRVTARLKKP